MIFQVVEAGAKEMLYGTVCTDIECLLESRGSLVGKQHGTKFRPVLTINWRSEASLAIHHPESAYLSRICYLVGPPSYRTMPRTRYTLLARDRARLLCIATRFMPLKFFHDAHAILKAQE